MQGAEYGRAGSGRVPEPLDGERRGGAEDLADTEEAGSMSPGARTRPSWPANVTSSAAVVATGIVARPVRSSSRGWWRPTSLVLAVLERVAVGAPGEKATNAWPTVKPRTSFRPPLPQDPDPPPRLTTAAAALSAAGRGGLADAQHP